MGQAGNTEGCSSSRRRPCQAGEAALTGEWQVPAGRIPKATESGATACVSGHVGAGAVPGRPRAASLPGVPLSWRYPAAPRPKAPNECGAPPRCADLGQGAGPCLQTRRLFSFHLPSPSFRGVRQSPPRPQPTRGLLLLPLWAFQTSSALPRP